MAEQITVDTYEFPDRPAIKGYPELRWAGKRPFKSTQYFPAQLRERYGGEKDGWINKIFWGDNLQVMSHLLKDYRGKIDLVYIDPPFDSRATYTKKIQIKKKKAESDQTSFEEKQYGDIWTNDEYLQFMYERLVLIYQLLSDRGSIYLHCDYRQSHYLKCILDSIFGPANFRNEITWRRQIPRGMKVYAEYYAFSADYILIYSKNFDRAIWNRQTKTNKLTVEEAGKKYMRDDKGFFRTSDPGSYSFESLVDLYNQGRLYAPKSGEVIIDYDAKEVRASNGGKIGVKYYREMDAEGYVNEEITIDNIWDDIPGMGIVSSEFIGYPTQKPQALLERIIKASSNPGDLVFDCFMGSGTTQAVAMKLGRRFIGADINLGAVQTTTKRLLGMSEELNLSIDGRADGCAGFEVYNVNNYDFFRNPAEAKELIISALEIRKFDAGGVYDGELDGRMVKILPVNRIATKADLEELKANLPYKTFERRKAENPNTPVERITLVCMGHEPDLKASLIQELSEYKLDVEIVDILRDKSVLRLKREAEADVVIEDGKLKIRAFYPMNLMQKLSLQKEYVEDWKQLVESVMIDWNYDGAVMAPSVTDVAEKDEFVSGEYIVPKEAGIIKVKITDLLSESLEVVVR